MTKRTHTRILRLEGISRMFAIDSSGQSDLLALYRLGLSIRSWVVFSLLLSVASWSAFKRTYLKRSGGLCHCGTRSWVWANAHQRLEWRSLMIHAGRSPNFGERNRSLYTRTQLRTSRLPCSASRHTHRSQSRRSARRFPWRPRSGSACPVSVRRQLRCPSFLSGVPLWSQEKHPSAARSRGLIHVARRVSWFRCRTALPRCPTRPAEGATDAWTRAGTLRSTPARVAQQNIKEILEDGQ